MKRCESWEFVCRFDPGNLGARQWLWRRLDAVQAIRHESTLFDTFLACYGDACAFGFSGGGMNVTAEAFNEPRQQDCVFA
jgi:hypothetical protein